MKIRNACTFSNVFLAKYGTFHLAVGAAGARAAGPGLDMAAAGRALRVRVDRQARRRLGTAAAGASTARPEVGDSEGGLSLGRVHGPGAGTVPLQVAPAAAAGHVATARSVAAAARDWSCCGNAA